MEVLLQCFISCAEYNGLQEHTELSQCEW